MIVALLVIVAICTFIIHKPYSYAIKNQLFTNLHDATPPPVEFWVGFAGILLSFVSIVMVIITMVFQIYQLRLQNKSLDQVAESNIESFQIAQSDYNAYVLRLVENYLSSEMAQCRQIC